METEEADLQVATHRAMAVTRLVGVERPVQVDPSRRRVRLQTQEDAGVEAEEQATRKGPIHQIRLVRLETMGTDRHLPQYTVQPLQDAYAKPKS